MVCPGESRVNASFLWLVWLTPAALVTCVLSRRLPRLLLGYLGQQQITIIIKMAIKLAVVLKF
jgi:hypothetical protein